ncbi:hypothetical protein BDW67DRAFT_173250 [Aspergillus spinulosporus]
MPLPGQALSLPVVCQFLFLPINPLLLATAGMVQGYTIDNSGYIMRKSIDSIVQPHRYASHMHCFFRNNALISGCATNSNPNDLSVYSYHQEIHSAEIPFSTDFKTQLRFPDCINPNTLASDYSSRVWLANANRCPDDSINGWLPEAAENMMLATDKREFQCVTGPRSEMKSCTPADVD